MLIKDHFPQFLSPLLPLDAIIIPQVAEDTMSRLQPIKASQAFLAIVPTTVFQLPGTNQTAVTFLRRLVTRLPCYLLHLGSDLVEIPATIQSVIRAAK